MQSKLLLAAAAGFLSLTAGASAQTAATATNDLNMRSGPGPQFPVIGVIKATSQVNVTGCIQGSKWCTVTVAGAQGWAYSDYLTAPLSGAPVVMTQRYADVGVPTVTYEAPAGGAAGGATTGAAGGAIAGALIGGPIGAVVGGVAGAAVGATTDAVTEPTPEVRTYVTQHQVEPVYLEGEAVVGAGLPESVPLQEIPKYQYRYVYLNGQPVLVDPATRRIVYVVR